MDECNRFFTKASSPMVLLPVGIGGIHLYIFPLPETVLGFIPVNLSNLSVLSRVYAHKYLPQSFLSSLSLSGIHMSTKAQISINQCGISCTLSANNCQTCLFLPQISSVF